MQELRNGIPAVSPKSRKEWRRWLEKNHEKEKGVWLIIYKKESRKATVYYPEAVEEALCFGWIDSKPNKRDDESYYQFFTRRSPKSKWSKINKQRVELLIDKKLMRPAGLAAIQTAQMNGTWNALDDIDNIVIPKDLQMAFKRNKNAATNFNAFPKSSQKIILQWILDAKTAGTRDKRVKEAVTLASQNIRANHYRRAN